MRFTTFFCIGLLTITASTFAFKAKAQDGYSSSKEAIAAFLKPLKQGKQGITQAFNSIEDLNGDSLKYTLENLKQENSNTKNDLEFQLSEQMKNGEKLISAKKIESTDRLNGMQQMSSYELTFSGGKKRIINFTTIRPTVTGGFRLMKINLD